MENGVRVSIKHPIAPNIFAESHQNTANDWLRLARGITNSMDRGSEHVSLATGSTHD